MHHTHRRPSSRWLLASLFLHAGCGSDSATPAPDASLDAADTAAVVDTGPDTAPEDLAPGDMNSTDLAVDDTTVDDTATEDMSTSNDTVTPADTEPDDTTTDTSVAPDIIVDPCISTLSATVRDLRIDHPDFEDFVGVDAGIVENRLGVDGKPVYTGNPITPTTSGAANFDQWYRDVDGVNQAFQLLLPLTPSNDGMREYRNSFFFPIDNLGWGNEGNSHNYHFTVEMHARFEYRGGESITITGDDDIWLFINGALVIDLGGVHGPLAGSVDLDASATALGLQVGGMYTIDLFTAERHTTQSNLNIVTNVACFLDP